MRYWRQFEVLARTVEGVVEVAEQIFLAELYEHV
jgi:hypothetical protein